MIYKIVTTNLDDLLNKDMENKVKFEFTYECCVKFVDLENYNFHTLRPLVFK